MPGCRVNGRISTGRMLTAAEAKGGKYTYYVCQSILESGSGSC